ncbi:MAG: GGDEF domain-containing protein, partial [Wenzhouxiangellaceae bacterium]
MTEDKPSENRSSGRLPARSPTDPADPGVRFAEFHSAMPRRGIQAWIDRFRTEFRFAMVTLFGGIASIVIFPFALYRFYVGDWMIALFDLVITLVFLSLVVLAWRFENAETVGKLAALLLTLSALAAVLGFDLPAIWVFAVLVANFLLAAGWFAAILSALLIGAIVLQHGAFDDPVEFWAFLSVAVLVALFSSLFAYRSNLQHESLSELAHHDPLTGAGNRRALRQDLTRIVSLAREHHLEAGLALLDLDQFKPVNDRHGHDTGDRILVEFAEIIQATLRTSDRCYRFGGDEFVVLLPGTRREGLVVAVTKLRERIRAELESPDGPVTASIGATGLLPGETVHAWLSRADRALYRAKAEG